MCGRKVPPAFDARELVAPKSDGPLADIVALGIQEVIPLSAGNVIAGGAMDAVTAWERRLAAAFNGEAWADAYLPQQGGDADAAAAAGAAPSAGGGSGAQLLLLQNMASKWLGGGSGGAAASAAAGAGGGDPGSDALAACAYDEAKYLQVASKQLVGVYLSVWVKKKMLPHVSGERWAAGEAQLGGEGGEQREQRGGGHRRGLRCQAACVLGCAHHSPLASSCPSLCHTACLVQPLLHNAL